jgi:diguanylate cyclase (GGDEF)-like protein
MKWITPPVRLSIGLVCLTISILLFADLVGVLPDTVESELGARKKVVESLAVQLSVAASENETAIISQTLRSLVERNDDVLTAALRGPKDELIASVGPHEEQWANWSDHLSTDTNAVVPIYKGADRWGTAEVSFAAILPRGVIDSAMTHPVTRLLGFIAVVGFAAYLVFLRRNLRHLDPSAVIPDRVKRTLDVLSEGVVILDSRGRVVLANSNFAIPLGVDTNQLLGVLLDSLNWIDKSSGLMPNRTPWTESIDQSRPVKGAALELAPRGQTSKIYAINSSPILGEDGERRGVIVTFDDITELERKNQQLEDTVSALEATQEEVERRNEELRILASSDSLTGVLNRRAFMEQFEAAFRTSDVKKLELSCIMCDLDQFKVVNDTHGHSTGDEVIKALAAVLRQEIPEPRAICRYGGEEFCIMLPETPASVALRISEQVREALELQPVQNLSVTASFGVSSTRANPSSPLELLDQADAALYRSKANGRNRVTEWPALTAARARQDGLLQGGEHVA